MRLDIHNSQIPALCRACEARHQGICGALTPPQLLRLGQHARRHEFPPGVELVATGEKIERYANILSGIVKLTMMMPDGRQQIVGLQFAPDFLGRPFEANATVSAEAASTVRICAFPKKALEAMVQDSPELEHRLHVQALRELDEARAWMLTLGRKTAAEKVAAFLLLVARHADPEAKGRPIRFDVALTRAEIADFLGLTVETVSRQLTLLRKAGSIRMEKHRTVSVLDPAVLKTAAGE
jgi:CRP/FNR family transcriptional regulator, anaerobic regulatory protein